MPCLFCQVSVPPASSAMKEEPSSSTEESENGEVSTGNQADEKITLGDALSLNRATEASPASVEELQSLAGGADIKVVKLLCLLFNVTIRTFHTNLYVFY